MTNIIELFHKTLVVGSFIITEPKYNDTYKYQGYFSNIDEMKRFMNENAMDGNIITLIDYKIIKGNIDDYF